MIFSIIMNFNFSKIDASSQSGHLSYFALNPELMNNPHFLKFFQNSEFEKKLAQEIAERSLPVIPLSSHLEARTNLEILYSHPDYITKGPEMDNLANINEYRALPSDSMNRWYENFDFHNFKYYNYIHFLYKSTEENLKSDMPDKLQQFKTKCEKDFVDISQNEKLKEKYINTKLLINNLQSVNSQNLLDSLQWAKMICEDVKFSLRKECELIVLLRSDLFELFSKLQNLCKSITNDEERMLALRILFYTAEAFESFHGLILLVELLEKYDLGNKFFESVDWDGVLKRRRDVSASGTFTSNI